MPYNVKYIDYPNGGQLRLYSKTVGFDNYKPIDDKLTLDYLDTRGELHEVRLGSETGRLSSAPYRYTDPFTGERENLRSMSEIEHSQRTSRNRTLNNLYYDARSNHWDWFVTLTFAPDKVNRYDYDACTKKLHNWLSNCRKICPDMRYIVVPELHKDGAYHFHGLFSKCENLGFVDSGVRDKKSGKPIYNIGKYRHGFTTATRVQDIEKVSKYICKYITKELCSATFGKKRYWKSRNLEQAEVTEMTLKETDKERLLEILQEYIKHKKTVEYTSEYHIKLKNETKLTKGCIDKFDIECITSSVDYIELASEVCIEYIMGVLT